MIAMTNTTKEGVELWVLDIKKAKIKKIVGPRLNANLGSVISWYKDSRSLLVKFVPSNIESIKLSEELVPTGPRFPQTMGQKLKTVHIKIY